MNRERLVILVSFLLILVFITGCGRKTPPVYSEKGVVSIAEEEKNKE